MYSTPWSDAEVMVLKEYYSKHGIGWEGWAEVLPGRTMRAIQRKANGYGLVVETPRKPTRPKNAKRPDVFDTHVYKVSLRSADPAEPYILRKLADGCTPSEIDKIRGWWPGRTVQILSERWLRDKEKQAKDKRRQREDEHHGRAET